ncbi:ABC transporter permease [Pelagicoccus mobilis]|uniref:ABC transporter permease n=1 Tax=Pelagicoccus mobilis TaxID=415221 RepID=A0A934VLA9_9BACT|nr:ABC transporter permease [Pelagicoccus mobilis]MBK1877566.1 ABC transporter permease [Pelagicoccus mobilis]
MKSDFIASLRLIRNHPWFSLAIIVTLAFGIGINTTVFTLANAVLFKPVPFPDGERLVSVSGRHPKNENWRMNLSYPDFTEFQAQTKSLEQLEGVNRFQAILSETGVAPERFSAARVTPDLFDMLQTLPAEGRPFSEQDFLDGSNRTALISSKAWKTRYGNDPDVIGSIVRLNGEATEIIGIMPDQFRFPSNEDVWIPYRPENAREDRSKRPLQAFAMLSPGSNINDANAELSLVAANISQEHPETNEDIGVDVLTFHERFNGGPIRIVFLAMMTATAFVLLIACSNVANLLLSRALTRRQEISIRSALGGRRSQIVRQLLTESVSLSILGGILGLTITALGVHAFDQATQDVGKPSWILFELDHRVFIYFALISIGSGLLFGILPAFRASRLDLNNILKDGVRGSDSKRTKLLSSGLVAFQFAMTFVLLTGAGLMLRSFFQARGLNDFLPAETTLTASIGLPERAEERYATPEKRREFYKELKTRLENLQRAKQVVLSSHLPGLGAAKKNIEIDGQEITDPENPPRASYIVQSEGYFSLTNIPLQEGRSFLNTDIESNQRVAIASEEFANKHWPEESALGKRFCFPEKDKERDWITIVGVVSDIVQEGQNEDAPPLVYLPHSQQPWGYMNIMLAIGDNPLSATSDLKTIVQDLDTDLPVFNIRTLKQAMERNYWFLNVFGTLFLSFAAIGLIMASIGIYASVAQSTARRVQEIGIRIALGAHPSHVARLVLKRGILQMAAGLIAGLALAFSTTHLLSGNLLFRVSPRDPIVFTFAIAMLAAIGTAASWLPARRATKLSPTQALRED